MDDLLKLAKQFDINMFRQDEGEDEGEGAEDEGVGEGVEDKPPSEDRHTWDDLDFLFDGPTQCVSGGLSQVSSPANPSSSAAAAANTKDTLANDAFEDDWDNDDFLHDSLVFEMTQNPQNFAAPKHCSTQKPASPGRAPVSQSAGEKDQVRGRRTFKLESGPSLPVGRLQTDTWTNGSDPKDARQTFSCGPPGGQWTRVEPQNPVHRRTSVQSNMAAEQSRSSRHEAPDLLDDDLLAIFSSDPVWDDPADDDLLCEVCDDLENQIRSSETVSAPQRPAGNPRAALQPANRNLLPCGGSSLAGGFVSNGVRTSPAAAGSFSGPTCVQGSSWVQPAPQGNGCRGQFTFKKPSNSVSTATSKGKSSSMTSQLGGRNRRFYKPTLISDFFFARVVFRTNATEPGLTGPDVASRRGVLVTRCQLMTLRSFITSD